MESICSSDKALPPLYAATNTVIMSAFYASGFNKHDLAFFIADSITLSHITQYLYSPSLPPKIILLVFRQLCAYLWAGATVRFIIDDRVVGLHASKPHRIFHC